MLPGKRSVVLSAVSIADARFRRDAACLSVPFARPLSGAYASTAHIVEHLLASTLAIPAEAEGGLVSARVDRHRIALTIEGDRAAVAEGVSAARRLLATEWFNPSALADALSEVDDERKSAGEFAALRQEAAQCPFFPAAAAAASQLEGCVRDFIHTQMAVGGARVVHVGERRLGWPHRQSLPDARAAVREIATAPALIRSRLRSSAAVMIWRAEPSSSVDDARLAVWARVISSHCGAGISVTLKQHHEGLLLDLAFSDTSEEALNRARDAFHGADDRAACSTEQLALARRLVCMSAADCARMALDGWRRTADPHWIARFRDAIEHGSPSSSVGASVRVSLIPWRAAIGANAGVSEGTFSSVLMRTFDVDVPPLAALADPKSIECANPSGRDTNVLHWPQSSVASALDSVHGATARNESGHFVVVRSCAGLAIETVSNTVGERALRLIAEALQHRTGLARDEAKTIGAWPPAAVGITAGDRVTRVSIAHSGGDIPAARLVMKACRALIEDPVQYRRARRLVESR